MVGPENGTDAQIARRRRVEVQASESTSLCRFPSSSAANETLSLSLAQNPRYSKQAEVVGPWLRRPALELVCDCRPANLIAKEIKIMFKITIEIKIKIKIKNRIKIRIKFFKFAYD